MPMCCIPGCKTGYKSCKEKFSTFRLPDDPQLLKLWKQKIPRQEGGRFTFSKATRVCAKHFKENDIVRYDEHIINGTIEKLKRDRPKLKTGTVPCIFLNSPSHLSNKTPARTTPMKRLLVEVKAAPCHSSAAAKPSIANEEKSNISSLLTPEINTWARTTPMKRIFVKVKAAAPCHSSAAAGSSSANEEESNILSLLTPEINTRARTTPMKRIFVKVKATAPCHSSWAAGPSSENEEESNIDLSLLTPEISILSPRQKIRNAEKTWRATAKIKALKKECDRLKSELRESKRKQDKFEKVEGGLGEIQMPDRQRLMITQILKEAQCASKYGMRYDHAWILNCVMLRIKSKKAYEFMRANNYMPLPSLSTLNSYMKNLFPNFDFQKDIFRILKDKLKDIPEWEKRGILVFDEMKLQEHVELSKT